MMLRSQELPWKCALLLCALVSLEEYHKYHSILAFQASQRILLQDDRTAKRSPFLPASSTSRLEEVDDLWNAQRVATSSSPVENDPFYRSSRLASSEQWETFLRTTRERHGNRPDDDEMDLFWEQIKYEAQVAVATEPQAGPQLYQGILSQPTLLSAICTVISHEIETELIPATTLKDLFLHLLTTSKDVASTIRQDLQAVVRRDPSIETAMEAILFHQGFHALVCYRVGHLLWHAPRTGLAYYMQSTVSRIYAADIHPAATLGAGIDLQVGVGVVIGETAVVGNDVSIGAGVTLGGTGKESGDRHPKVGNGVVIYGGATILGNIPIGEGSIVSAKSIVTKPLPPLAIVSGVPATILSYRTLQEAEFDDHLQKHLVIKYLDRWRDMNDQRLANVTQTK